jgi:hypothetical protein
MHESLCDQVWLLLYNVNKQSNEKSSNNTKTFSSNIVGKLFI